MKAGDKVIVYGYRSTLTRDCTLEELTAGWGMFYGYEPFTGYPVFDSQSRVDQGLAP